MTPLELKQIAVNEGLEAAIDSVLGARSVVACADEDAYARFCNQVCSVYPTPAQVFIAGSGNWGFSLNPDKNLRVFGAHSDIDVGIIHEAMFNSTWEELRTYHRNYYYQIPTWQKNQLRRSGENVYSGFVSPLWIPTKQNQFRYNHSLVLNKLRSALIGFKPVKILFFKNKMEVIDYYKRGFYLLNTL